MELNIKLSEDESREILAAVIKQSTQTTSQQIAENIAFSKEEFETLFVKALSKSIRNILREHFEGRLFTMAENLFPENLKDLIEKNK